MSSPLLLLLLLLRHRRDASWLNGSTLHLSLGLVDHLLMVSGHSCCLLLLVLLRSHLLTVDHLRILLLL